MISSVSAREDLESVIGTFSLGAPRPGSPTGSWSGLVHELRNLLQTASAAINIIDRDLAKACPKLRRAVQGAKVSVGNACELICRATAPQLPDQSRKSTGDIDSFLAEVAAVISNAVKPGVELDFVIEADLPPIQCDKVDLQNALLNLVLNARQAVRADGRIGISVRRVSGEPAVEFRIADNGVGMCAETLAKAFDPGFTTRPSGTGGLGLPMVENFIRRAGGTVRINSGVGTGTIVTVRVPSAPFSVQTEKEGRS